MAKDATPEVGRKAPAFSLTGTGGKKVALKDFHGKKNLVLYFYPKDDTPGCTMEPYGFRDACGPLVERQGDLLINVEGFSQERNGRAALLENLMVDRGHTQKFFMQPKP